MNKVHGTVFWLTGLSGSGKTTIGKELTKQLRQNGNNVIFLDGDELRDMMGGHFGYESEDRQKIGFCYSRLCNLIASQGANVVCATVSLFEKIQEWNRANISNYIEILIQAPMDELKRRDIKNIYSKVISSNVVGIDIKPHFPKNPDCIITNHGENAIQNSVNQILSMSLRSNNVERI